MQTSGYGRKRAAHDPGLTHVGPGTPGGELLRRYWQPVALSTDLQEVPVRVRILDEDLIAFRDGSGRAGLLEERCCHRGTSLYYGRVEPQGLRCCYHGWLFGVDGRCLEQPCEPPTSTYKDRVFQPSYPCREYGGLVFAYLGPPDRQPAFLKYDIVEEGEGVVVADGTSYGLGGGVLLDCNWLQYYENVMDPFHVAILHSRFSGEQFAPAMAAMPEVRFEETSRGMRSIQDRRLEDGHVFRRVTEVHVPNIRIVSSVAAGTGAEGFRRAAHVGWILPIDDSHTRMYSLLRVAVVDGKPAMPPRARHGGKLWAELTEAEHQRMPGDKEAIVGQGPITIHAAEHLASSDRGVIMARRMIAREIERARQGQDPMGIERDKAEATVTVEAGNYLLSSAT